MREPTTDEVQGLAAHLCMVYNCRIVSSDDDPECLLVAGVLQMLHDAGMSVPDKPTFLEGYWHTLPALSGPEVAVISHPADEMGRGGWGVCDTLVHEVTHSTQIKRDGALPFAGCYLGSELARARYEVEAYAASDELRLLRGAWWVETGTRCESLRVYACGDRAIKMATIMLQIRRATLLAGGQISPVARCAWAWLSAHVGG